MTVEKKQTKSKPTSKAAPKTKKTSATTAKKEAAAKSKKVATTEVVKTENKAPQSASKVIGSFAGKMLNLTQIGAKKLEDYAAKSAEENDNNNARKLAAVMKNFSKKLESNQDEYVEGVEKNAEELIALGKQTLGSMKKVYIEMKTRAQTAKDKAKQDVELCDEEENSNKKAPAKKAKK